MPVNVKCPNCGSLASVGDQSAGKVFQCPRCATRLAVRTINPETRVTQGGGAGTESAQMPKHIGGFAVRRVLGAGAFGTVYLGHDHTLDRPVALKVPHPHTFATPKTQKRFETEARAVAQLRHPHIVPIYAAGFDGEHYYIASQFIAGPAAPAGGAAQAMTLEEAIDGSGLGFEEAARVVRDLAEALDYAHDLGVVHRDVKPANVLLDGQRRPHLADFGLAHQESSAEKLTHDGAILGTPAYMAPEQAKGREGAVLPASDQYSLGVVLYELLTGKVPFSGPVGLVLSLHQNEEPKPPSQLRPRVPRDLETVCLKAMAKDPRKRYASCGLLAADLRRWLEGEPIRARRMGPVEVAARWVKRNPLVAGLAAAVALLLVVGTVVSSSYAWEAGAQKDRADHKAAEATRNADEAKKNADEAKANAEKANKNAEEAREQAKRADQNVAAAKASAAEAADNLHKAMLAQGKADEARKKAEENETQARRNLYVAHMQLAQQAYKDANWQRAVDLLEGDRPGEGQGDVRAFEWFYLHNLLLGNRPVFPRQEGPVATFDLSSDGRRYLIGEQNGAAVWDAETGRRLFQLGEHPTRIWNAAWSPKGDRIVTASRWVVGDPLANAGHLKVWDAATGKHLYDVPPPSRGRTDRGVDCLAMRSDGRVIAYVCGDDNLIHLWDLDARRETLTLEGHQGIVNDIAFSGDGKRLASASMDKTVRIWDAGSGKELFVYKEYKGEVNGVAFSPDGRGVFSFSQHGWGEKFWNAATGQAQVDFDEHGRGVVVCAAFSPDGKRLVWGNQIGMAIVFDATTGKQLFSWQAHTSAITKVKYSDDGKSIVTSSQDQTVRTWPAERPDEAQTLTGAWSLPGAIAMDPEKNRLVGLHSTPQPDGSQAASLAAWDLDKPGQPQVVAPLKLLDAVQSLAFHPGANLLAVSAMKESTFQVWDVAAGKVRFTDKVSDETRVSLAFTADGKRLAAAAGDAVGIWDVASGQAVLRFQLKHPQFVKFDLKSLTFSPDGKRLAAARDSWVEIWDAETGQWLRECRQYSGLVNALAFSSDGRWLAAASREVKVFEVETGAVVHSLPWTPKGLASLAFSADDHRLAVGGYDGTTGIWDMGTEQEVLALTGPVVPVTSVAFSPDGKSLVAVLQGGDVRIWAAPHTP